MQCAHRGAPHSTRGTAKRPWTDSLRVAAAVYAADQLPDRGCAADYIADRIFDLRLIDYRRRPWPMDAAEVAYGPALRPNPFVEPLVRRGLITVGGWL